MKKHVCNVCGYIYDPTIGDTYRGINPGVSFENLPENWECPICRVSKKNFSIYKTAP
jgi:rubredoxin